MTIREYALQAWTAEQEKHKHALYKKAKRKAKKIEEEIAELFADEVEEYKVERTLEHPHYEAIVTVHDDAGALQFTYDVDDDLVLIGVCSACQQEATSKPIDNAADLGQLLESFAPGKAHACASHTP